MHDFFTTIFLIMIVIMFLVLLGIFIYYIYVSEKMSKEAKEEAKRLIDYYDNLEKQRLQKEKT